MNPIYLIITAAFLMARPDATHGSDEDRESSKLSVTIVEGSGKCLLDKTWVPVKGERIYWEITGVGKPRWHHFNEFHPLEKSRPLSTDRLDAPFHFSINFLRHEMSEEHYKSGRKTLESTWPELAYADQLGKEMKKELLPATVIQQVDERKLFLENKHNDSSPFKNEWSDTAINIPTRYSACEMRLEYKMKRATALFTKNLLGSVKITKDDTKSHRNPKTTFAQDLLLGKGL